jgi:hypothetical protein
MKQNNFKLRRAPFVLLGIFLLMWLMGISLNEPTRVLEQAKSICLECIGIG